MCVCAGVRAGGRVGVYVHVRVCVHGINEVTLVFSHICVARCDQTEREGGGGGGGEDYCGFRCSLS